MITLGALKVRIKKGETNSRAFKLKRRDLMNLNCDVCPPNRGCNAPRSSGKRNHGQKPRYKDKK